MVLQRTGAFMLRKLFSSSSDSGSDSDKDAPTVRGGAVLETYEKMVKKGDTPPPMLLNQVGDLYRDLGQARESAQMYVHSSEGYASEEAWTAALQMVRKAGRVLDDAGTEAVEVRQQMALMTVQVSLGRGEWVEAALAVEEAAEFMTPSDARAIDRLVEICDLEPLADPEVEVALAELLLILGRPERAVERYEEALRRAKRFGNERMVDKIEAKLAQARPFQPKESRSRRRARSRQEAGSASAKAIDAPTRGEEDSTEAIESGDVASADRAPEDAGSESADARDDRSAEEPFLPPLVEADAPETAPVEDPEPELPEMEAAAEQPNAGQPGPVDGPEETADEAAPDTAPAPEVFPGFAPLPENPVVVDLEEETSEPGAGSDASEDVESSPIEAEEPRAEATGEPADPFVRPADLRSGEPKKTDAEDSRIVGTDARAKERSEDDEVRELVRQLRAGIRETVPQDEVETHYDLGLSFLSMGMHDDAVEAFQLAFRAPELRRRSIEGLAESLLGRGDAKLAHRAVRTAREELDEPGQETLGLLYWQARAAEDLGERDEAEDLYERICLADVRFRDAHDRLDALTGTRDG